MRVRANLEELMPTGGSCSMCEGHGFICDSFDMVGPCSNHPEQNHPNRRPCPSCEARRFDERFPDGVNVVTQRDRP